MSLRIVTSGSLICRSPWLLRYKGLDLGAFQKHLARDLEYPESSFLDESGNGLPGYAANASGFRL